MGHLSISLLGGFEVALDGQPLTAFGADKVRALLAYLAMEAGRPHRRAALAGLLWPELPEERAAHSLRQSLLLLRRALGESEPRAGAGEPFLVLGRQDIQFNPLSDYRLDVATFVELLRAVRQHGHASGESCGVCAGWLRDAVDLYRGDLLAGFTVRDSVPFEEWRVAQQEALHGQALEALGLLAEHYERQGAPGQVLATARRLLALEPWQERAQMQVMTALAQTGQDAAALEQYANYSRMLAGEFGLEPSAAVAALQAKIRARRLASREERVAAVQQDERRQVTALVCRRQSPGGELDPEELRERQVWCQAQCLPVVERYGGQRQARAGSDCIVYFGYPVAQEDAARRAVAAGLGMVAAVAGGDQLRIGAHTGIMVSAGGELVGNVPELAGDVMRLAEPNGVVISAETERLVRGWFESQALAAPGAGGAALAYVVHGAREGQDRVGWLAEAHRLTPLAGREGELEQLVASVAAARSGQGQVVTVAGEPGMGKSRLVWELKQRCGEQVRWLESRCSPYFQNTSLYPIVGLLEELLGFEAVEDGAARRAKLAAALARYDMGQPGTLWLLSVLLGLPVDTTPPAITQEQRERMREVSLALLARAARREPLVLVIEDLHWADPTTVSWIGRSVNELLAMRCALVLTWRPTFVAPWPPQSQVVEVELGPLSADQTTGMVARIKGGETLATDALAQIVRQTDGIPLYVEELTQTFLGQSARRGAGDKAELPASLRDSLTAHLDQTGVAKETAQWAAVLGRGFSVALLAAVVPFDERRLQSDLEQLAESRVLTARNVAGGPGYVFRHALLQDAAYGMLLKRTRQANHRRIAAVLASGLLGIADRQPELLAHHYEAGGLRAEAADQWMLAGERALAQAATEEASAFFERAAQTIEPEDLARRRRALLGWEAALNLRSDREAQRVVINSLIDLARAAGSDEWLAEAVLRQAQYANRMSDFRAMLAASEEARAASVRAGDLTRELEALGRKVQALGNLGELEAARGPVNEILSRLPLVSDEVVKGYALARVSLYYGHMGDFSTALVLLLQGATAARRAGDRYWEGRFLANVGLHYCQLGRYADALAAHQEGLALAEAIGDWSGQQMQKWNISYALWCGGEPDRARAVGEAVQRELRSAGAQPAMPLAACLGHLGLILEDAGEAAQAAAYLAEACAIYLDATFEGPRIELLATQARCMVALGRPDEARRMALEVLEYLKTRGHAMIDFPARVYTHLADVVAAVETPGIQSRELLQTGYEALMRSADTIEDPEWRRSFLEDEVSNQVLQARWKAVQGSE